MKIAVIGTGYVGLVAGACFSDTGNEVYCVDKDASKVERLKKGIIPIYEPGLETLVHRNFDLGRLKFTTSIQEAVHAAEVIFMAVGTPPLPNGEPDLQYLEQASYEIGESMNGYKLIVNKSTVPIGSHMTVANWISKKTRHPFDVASNPEFLKEGSALDDFLKPDRVVIGTTKKEVYEKMVELYGPFVRQGNPILWMDPVSAEITKYACNAFLATRISFMNELAQLCEKVGGDVELVRKGMTSDIRIGKHFLYAGAGYGGSCFPKDVQALLAKSRREDVPMGIIEAAENANQRQKKHLVKRVVSHFGKDLSGHTFALWGIAFKPNTDDIREAPALAMIEELLALGAQVRAYDPVAMDNARAQVKNPKLAYCKDAYDCATGASAVLLVTEWNEFRQVDLTKVKSLLKTLVIFDGRNIYDPELIRKQGFKYYGIGRG